MYLPAALVLSVRLVRREQQSAGPDAPYPARAEPPRPARPIRRRAGRRW